jgi:hypothetical protein
MNKRLLISESHGDSNRCTCYMGKSDQHATRFPRSVRVWPSTICISCGSYMATFHTVVNIFEQIYCPWEGLPTQSIAHQLTDSRVRIQLLSHNSQWSNEKKSIFCWQPTPRLIGPINTSMGLVRSILTRGVNSSVLNQHRRGLQPWRCRLSTYHSSTFLTDGLHFPPKGPARSPV